MYFADARRRAEADVAARPPRPRRPRRQPDDRPAPGVVQVRLTASTNEDIQTLITQLRDAGVTLWAANRKAYRHDNGAI